MGGLLLLQGGSGNPMGGLLQLQGVSERKTKKGKPKGQGCYYYRVDLKIQWGACALFKKKDKKTRVARSSSLFE